MKDILVIMGALVIIALSACKGPKCEVKCNGHECACAKSEPDTKVDDDTTDLPEAGTETGWVDKLEHCFKWEERNA